MDVRAILIAAPPAEGLLPENMAGVPLALLDVLGKPVLVRVADRLRRFGIAHILVVGELGAAALPFARPLMNKALPWVHTANGQVWRGAESAFGALAQSGADIVLVLRIGAYAEVDFDELIQFHLDQRSRVTPVCTPDGVPLDIVAITSARRNDAAFLFRHGLRDFRAPAARYVFRGYVNRLRHVSDLRRLAGDAFLFRAQVPPEGAEIRPGVWVAPGARIQRGARILAPAYVGRRAKVRAAALLTRGSAVEHHAVVDCGTVVEDSSILPYTRIGAGLDVAHAVVGFRRIHHLRRGVETEIADARLVSMVPPRPSLRALGQAVSLAAFLPAQILRAVFAPSHREAPAQLPAAVQAPSPALHPPAGLPASEASEAASFPANLVAARRYGDQ